MTANADTRASTVGHGSVAVGMELLVEIAETVASAKGGLPAAGIHGEILQILEVNHETTVASKSKVAVHMSGSYHWDALEGCDAYA